MYRLLSPKDLQYDYVVIVCLSQHSLIFREEIGRINEILRKVNKKTRKENSSWNQN